MRKRNVSNQAPATVSLAMVSPDPAKVRAAAATIRQHAATYVGYTENATILRILAPYGITTESLTRAVEEWEEQADHLDALASSLEQTQAPAKSNGCTDHVTITLRRDRAEWLRGLATVLYAGCPQGEEERHADLVRAVESALSPTPEWRD